MVPTELSHSTQEMNKLHSLKLTVRTWKLMVGRILSFRDIIFLGAFAVSFKEGSHSTQEISQSSSFYSLWSSVTWLPLSRMVYPI